ncbi:MAG: hypothetical protein A2Y25_11515 [Candidatus Melainabacteria bacterium GWF2_37_15]|nr:MAG: hypothetical protein A2Y25_11515 [Candidatus Melainabacteria bacterium GWF2_37_15]
MHINPSFSSQKLYDAKIRNKNKEPINVQITKLSYDDPEDREAMMNIKLLWQCLDDFFDPALLKKIDENFKSKNGNTLAVELVGSSKLEGKVLCLASVSGNEINFLQARTDVEYKSPISDPKRKFYGAGKALMWGICKHAKDNNFNEVTVNSCNDNFYKTLGMKPAPKLNTKYGHNYFVFDPKDMDSFIKETRHKYETMA